MISPVSPSFFSEQVKEWSSPPIDGVGYLPSEQLLTKTDDELRLMVLRLEQERYDVKGWRNFNNKWRRALGLDTTTDKYVLDYGCGSGIEALQYAKTNNRIVLADISSANLKLAFRVLRVFGFDADVVLVRDRGPLPLKVDIFHACGVIHHIPSPTPVLAYASDILNDNGEIRLMLYSDKGWELSTNTDTPPIEEDVSTNPKFEKFTKTFDAVGNYADWYNADKIQYRFPFLRLEHFEYLCSDDAYCAAILKKK